MENANFTVKPAGPHVFEVRLEGNSETFSEGLLALFLQRPELAFKFLLILISNLSDAVEKAGVCATVDEKYRKKVEEIIEMMGADKQFALALLAGILQTITNAVEDKSVSYVVPTTDTIQ